MKTTCTRNSGMPFGGGRAVEGRSVWRLLRSALLTLGFTASLSVIAGSARADEADAKSLVQQAYTQTQKASSIEDFTAVIGICEQAQKLSLSAEQAAYVERLLGWAYNKRGEKRLELASTAVEAGQSEQAAALDQEAQGDFELAVAHDPQRWKPFQNRGVSYALAGRYPEAEADFTRVIELQPDHANAWFNRAEVRYELKKYDEAVVDYTESLAREPDDLGAVTGRGHAHFRAGRFAEALEDYQQSVRLAPELPDAYANRGDAQLKLGQWEAAARDYRRAMRLGPESPRAFQSAAWLMATCPDERFRDSELAVKTAEKLLELAGDQLALSTFDTLAAAYANAGRYEEAVQTLDQAIDLAPEEVKRDLTARRELYQASKPFRESGTATARSREATVTTDAGRTAEPRRTQAQPVSTATSGRSE